MIHRRRPTEVQDQVQAVPPQLQLQPKAEPEVEVEAEVREEEPNEASSTTSEISAIEPAVDPAAEPAVDEVEEYHFIPEPAPPLVARMPTPPPETHCFPTPPLPREPTPQSAHSAPSSMENFDPRYPHLRLLLIPTYRGRTLRADQSDDGPRFYDDAAVFVGRLVKGQETEQSLFERFSRYGQIVSSLLGRNSGNKLIL